MSVRDLSTLLQQAGNGPGPSSSPSGSRPLLARRSTLTVDSPAPNLSRSPSALALQTLLSNRRRLQRAHSVRGAVGESGRTPRSARKLVNNRQQHDLSHHLSPISPLDSSFVLPPHLTDIDSVRTKTNRSPPSHSHSRAVNPANTFSPADNPLREFPLELTSVRSRKGKECRSEFLFLKPHVPSPRSRAGQTRRSWTSNDEVLNEGDEQTAQQGSSAHTSPNHTFITVMPHGHSGGGDTAETMNTGESSSPPTSNISSEGCFARLRRCRPCRSSRQPMHTYVRVTLLPGGAVALTPTVLNSGTDFTWQKHHHHQQQQHDDSHAEVADASSSSAHATGIKLSLQYEGIFEAFQRQTNTKDNTNENNHNRPSFSSQQQHQQQQQQQQTPQMKPTQSMPTTTNSVATAAKPTEADDNKRPPISLLSSSNPQSSAFVATTPNSSATQSTHPPSPQHTQASSASPAPIVIVNETASISSKREEPIMELSGEARVALSEGDHNHARPNNIHVPSPSLNAINERSNETSAHSSPIHIPSDEQSQLSHARVGVIRLKLSHSQHPTPSPHATIETVNEHNDTNIERFRLDADSPASDQDRVAPISPPPHPPSPPLVPAPSLTLTPIVPLPCHPSHASDAVSSASSTTLHCAASSSASRATQSLVHWESNSPAPRKDSHTYTAAATKPGTQPCPPALTLNAPSAASNTALVTPITESTAATVSSSASTLHLPSTITPSSSACPAPVPSVPRPVAALPRVATLHSSTSIALAPAKQRVYPTLLIEVFCLDLPLDVAHHAAIQDPSELPQPDPEMDVLVAVGTCDLLPFMQSPNTTSRVTVQLFDAEKGDEHGQCNMLLCFRPQAATLTRTDPNASSAGDGTGAGAGAGAGPISVPGFGPGLFELDLLALKHLRDPFNASAIEQAEWSLMRKMMMAVIVYLAGGVGFYVRYEGWSVLDAIYFVLSTATTTGYGDLYPTSPASRIFTMFFILVGIGMIAIALGIGGGLLLERQEQELYKAMMREKTNKDPTTSNTNDLHQSATVATGIWRCCPSWFGYTTRRLLESFILFNLVVWIGAIAFWYWEDLSFLDSVYMCVVTISTVGYGDVYPSTKASRAFSIPWIVIAALLVTRCIGEVTDIYMTRTQADRARLVLQTSVQCVEDLAALDDDNSGQVSELEFLKHFLVKTNACKQRDIDAICQQFQALDVDGSGYLDAEDFKAANTRQQQIQQLKTERRPSGPAMPPNDR